MNGKLNMKGKPVDMKGKPVANSKRRWWVGLSVVLFGTGAAWGVWHYSLGSQINPEVEAKLTEIREQLSPSSGTTLPPERRRELMTSLRQQIEQLPPEQRQQLRERGREAMHKAMEQRVHEFFALPPEQRTAALDKTIDEMEQRRKAWDQMRAQSGRPQGNRPQGAGQQGNRGSRRGPRSLDQNAQVARRVRRLDHSTPEMRAYFQLLRERRQARGLPDSHHRH